MKTGAIRDDLHGPYLPLVLEPGCSLFKLPKFTDSGKVSSTAKTFLEFPNCYKEFGRLCKIDCKVVGQYKKEYKTRSG